MTRFRLFEGKKTDGVGHGHYQVCIVRTKRVHVNSRCVGLNLKTVSISIIIKYFIMLFFVVFECHPAVEDVWSISPIFSIE